ncbi:hypothetical protein BD408DRAFT_410137 [Parasitella parasitica]|nr:hypothetical protein BD408DRAFT_410137 [Parasitella parasitica]
MPRCPMTLRIFKQKISLDHQLSRQIPTHVLLPAVLLLFVSMCGGLKLTFLLIHPPLCLTPMMQSREECNVAFVTIHCWRKTGV